MTRNSTMENKNAAAVFDKLQKLISELEDLNGAPTAFYCMSNGWFVEHFATGKKKRFDTFDQLVSYIHEWSSKPRIPVDFSGYPSTFEELMKVTINGKYPV